MKYVALVSILFLETSGAMAFPITVDSCGKTLTFEEAPKRAVTHDINITKMAFALGLHSSMVGVTGITGWDKRRYDESFRNKQGMIPELSPRNPNIETLIAVEADFLFAGWYYGLRPGGDVTPDTLDKHGIKTLILTESCIHVHDESRSSASLDLLFIDILKLGKIFNKETEAKKLITNWKKDLSEINEKIRETKEIRVFLYDSGEDKPFTAGKYAIPTALIDAAGGKNVMDDMPTSWGNTDWESVAIRNPQFLILLDYPNRGGYQRSLDFLKKHPAMKGTEAVKNECFVALTYEELTPGPDNIAAVHKIARALHPERF